MNFSTNPYRIVFYEKVACAGNAKQKKLLESYGLSFETRDLLETSWDMDSLKSFFKGLNKEDIINPFAPQIKNNLLDISKLSKEELIQKMCINPILIKRPLLEIGEFRLCGFDIQKINKILNIDICKDLSISTCQSNKPCTNV